VGTAVTSPFVEGHPRPTLTRPSWTDLCGAWSFAYDYEDTGLVGRWQERVDVFDRTIEVPFPPESARSGIGDESFHPVVWYRRTFLRPAANKSPDESPDRLLLHFGAVDYRATVWVNGLLVATHEGGHTPFSADISTALVDEDEQALVVRAEDLPGDRRQPRGKQDWEATPHIVWYRRTTGIWQPVWLEAVPATHLAAVRWTPDVPASALAVTVRLARTHQRPMRVRVHVALGEISVADDVYAVEGDEVTREIALPSAVTSLGRRGYLWSPEHPNLMTATVTLLEGDTEVDEVGSYTAMRSVGARGSRILLNEHPYFLKLVLAQNFWPESHLAAPDADALRREVELVKELGFNGLRLHQKIEDPRFLHWCDRVGVLVWAEMPSAYEFSTTTVHRLVGEWTEVLERDHNHPCVIAWVPINESWGVPAVADDPQQQELVRALFHLTKALDPTRLVVGNDGWEHVVTDITTVHDYTPDARVLRERYGDAGSVETTIAEVQPGYRAVLVSGITRAGEPVVLSEFGGLTLDTSDGETWHGYGVVTDAASLLKGYRELVDALLDSPAIAGFCYTQLTDTLQEKNGLVTEDRTPKIEAGEVHRINRRTSAAVPGDAAFAQAPLEDT
jgi:beta-galactosidase/beta-glucuronidase